LKTQQESSEDNDASLEVDAKQVTKRYRGLLSDNRKMPNPLDDLMGCDDFDDPKLLDEYLCMQNSALAAEKQTKEMNIEKAEEDWINRKELEKKMIMEKNVNASKKARTFVGLKGESAADERGHQETKITEEVDKMVEANSAAQYDRGGKSAAVVDSEKLAPQEYEKTNVVEDNERERILAEEEEKKVTRLNVTDHRDNEREKKLAEEGERSRKAKDNVTDEREKKYTTNKELKRKKANTFGCSNDHAARVSYKEEIDKRYCGERFPLFNKNCSECAIKFSDKKGNDLFVPSSDKPGYLCTGHDGENKCTVAICFYCYHKKNNEKLPRERKKAVKSDLE